MTKNILFSIALISILFFKANAQTDTSYYDLGRISVKKDFTQSITIKGTDLERYQFSDLADAINVWLYGTYSNSSSLVYVIDGNIITDVNAYSIYDVDEITLVQNALTQVSGAGPGQQMVLIKLKTNRPGKQGVEAAGQTSLVNMANQYNTPNVKSTRNIYDQYYVGAYKNFNDVHFGISADYQHDVLPLLSTSTYNSLNPFNFNRFKFNGYADAKLWRGTTVNFDINYVPQTTGFGFDDNSQVFEASSNQVYKSDATQHLVNSNIALRSHIVKGLTNTLSAAYSHYNYFETDLVNNVLNGPINQNYTAISVGRAVDRASNILIRDNLVYQKQLGIFDFEPSINFSYRNFHDTLSERAASFENLGTGNVEYSSAQLNGYGTKLYLLTPSVNIYYKDKFNLQAGFVGIANTGNTPTSFSGYSLQRLSPFLSASADVFKLSGIENMSLKVFGSFSRQNQLLDDSYATLAGFGSVVDLFSNNSPTFTTGTSSTTGAPIAYSDNNPYHQYNDYQAGFVLELLKNLSISYNYWNTDSQDLEAVLVPVAPDETALVLAYYNDKVIANRIGLNYSFYSNGFTWRTGLNVAQEKLEPTPNTNAAAAAYLSSSHRYSGGFTNRFTYKTLFAGLDILYQLGERPVTLENLNPYGTAPASAPHVNSVSLQNLYIGSQIKITHIKYAEVFANARNILQNNTSDITDNRRFYGLGLKVGL